MTYQDTLDYLFEQLPMYQRIGPTAYKANLDNTHAIMEMLDHPENDFRCIHIAGTNGKGSISHMLASILQQSGYKTALYTSPHLKDFRERIRVNGKMIERSEVVKFVKKYKFQFEEIKPSFFEWTVGLAFDYFSRKNVDIAVIETGMGGRLDSTNVVTPLVSVITNVQWDHMNLLGKTLPIIAKEKAGIIKDGIPVVIGETQMESSPVFRKQAKLTGSKIYFADKNYTTKLNNDYSGKPGNISVEVLKNHQPWLKDLILDLGGHYQLKNIKTVLQTVDILEAQGFEVNRKNIRKGLLEVKKNTGFSGRWQVLGQRPLIIADTAHNVDGIRVVITQIKNIDFKHLHIVLGMVEEKDIKKILKLLPSSATYYFCSPDIPRGLKTAILQKEAAELKLKGRSYKSVQLALDAAKDKAGMDDLIFVGGSTFVVAEVV